MARKPTVIPRDVIDGYHGFALLPACSDGISRRSAYSTVFSLADHPYLIQFAGVILIEYHQPKPLGTYLRFQFSVWRCQVFESAC